MLSHVEARIPIPDELPRFDTITELFRAAVEHAPEAPALYCRGRELTYRQLGNAVTALAGRLRAIDAQEGCIAVMMPNGIETVVASFAGMLCGGQLAPINPFFTQRELQPIAEAVQPTAILCVETTADTAREVAAHIGLEHVIVMTPEQVDADAACPADPDGLPETRAEDFVLLVQTGGTTGLPKGVNHTHRSLLYQTYLHCAMWPLEFGAERFLSVAPMFHIWGLGYATLVPIYTSSLNVIVPRFDADEVLRSVSEFDITVFGGGPAPIYASLTTNPLIRELDFSSLKYSLSGGAPCSAELHRQWRELTGCDLYEGWGMSEGAPFCINPAMSERRVMSVGNPAPETVVEVVDLDSGTKVLPLGESGELRVRGPQLMSGYRNRPEETAAALRDGWLYTGDIGYADEDGFVYLVDRKKDMVISGGFNVYPREIDEILVEHPAIAEAATVGVPDDRLGEVLASFVVPASGETLSEDDFFDYCRQNLVKYKRPVHLRIVDALPRTGASKIDKKSLRDTF